MHGGPAVRRAHGPPARRRAAPGLDDPGDLDGAAGHSRQHVHPGVLRHPRGPARGEAVWLARCSRTAGGAGGSGGGPRPGRPRRLGAALQERPPPLAGQLGGPGQRPRHEDHAEAALPAGQAVRRGGRAAGAGARGPVRGGRLHPGLPRPGPSARQRAHQRGGRSRRDRSGQVLSRQAVGQVDASGGELRSGPGCGRGPALLPPHLRQGGGHRREGGTLACGDVRRLHRQ
mmetsp:Transcript_26792/g.85076  ORF Transcript_26792/g.85076 Transcript_26792/m.85076 type:complete len:230 (+) Transcript_26792:334-1023(+)